MAGAGEHNSIWSAVLTAKSNAIAEKLVQVIYGSLFGMMLKDFVLHFSAPDLLLAAHHVVVCGLMLVLAFTELPGVMFMAFGTVLVEIGTCAYCAWVIYRWRRAYTWLMNTSNVVPVVGCGMCIYENFELCPTHMLVGYASFCGLVVGRTYVMLVELKKYPAHRPHNRGKSMISKERKGVH